MLATLLAVSLCTSAPLPPVQEQTDEFWTETLNQTLHDCFDDVDPAIPNEQVTVADHQQLVKTFCNQSYECTMSFGRQVLRELAPEEILFLMGHEAGHIALLRKDFLILGPEEAEYLADLIAVRRIPSGACHGVRALQWVREHMPADPEGAERVRQRRLALVAQCAAAILDAR